MAKKKLLKKKKPPYASVLRFKKKKPVGFQEVPMDIDKINASLTAANS
jgi:hypothetical protein